MQHSGDWTALTLGAGRRTKAVTAVAAGVLMFASSTAPASAAGDSGPELSLDFDASAGAGAVVNDVVNVGSGSVAATVVTLNGGQASTVESRVTQNQGLRFPTFDASLAGQRAIVKVVNSGLDDQLSPGTRAFTWGADLRIDPLSSSTVTGSADNGNNLVQRGLAGTQHQFKLELDKAQPACRVESPAGALRVGAPMKVDSSSWYRAICSRSGDSLTITVNRFSSTGALAQTWTRTAVFNGAGGLGAIAWGNREAPLSVGGKIYEDGRIAAEASDQFNGTIDNVFVDISN